MSTLGNPPLGASVWSVLPSHWTWTTITSSSFCESGCLICLILRQILVNHYCRFLIFHTYLVCLQWFCLLPYCVNLWEYKNCGQRSFVIISYDFLGQIRPYFSNRVSWRMCSGLKPSFLLKGQSQSRHICKLHVKIIYLFPLPNSFHTLLKVQLE